MRFSKIDLLTLLIGLFLFASCKSSNTLGLDVDPETSVEGELIDTLTIGTQTLADEPTSTGGLVRYPLGFLNDPLLGSTDASIALSLNVPVNKQVFQLDAALDSAVLVLPYSTEFYGDSTSVYSVDVHQLTQDLSVQTNFKSNREWAVNTSSDQVPNGIIGNFTGRIRPKTPVKFTDIVAGAADTVRTVKALRIKLDKNFVQNTILKAPVTALVNSGFFNSYFKGLRVSVNKEKSSGRGALPFFSMTYDSSLKLGAGLELYYKETNKTTATKTDTLRTVFSIVATTNPVAATIKHDYSGTAVETQLANTNVQYETTFLQGPTGLRNKISFPNLNRLIQELGGKVIINKAELVIPVEAGSDVAPFSPAERLALYRVDIAGQRVNIPDNLTTDKRSLVDYGGKYDADKKRYTFVITSYMQDLIDKKTEDYGTFLATTGTADFNLSPIPTSGARSIIGSFNNPTNKIKLNIYYTRIK